MHNSSAPAPRQGSAVSTLGKRALAWVVVLAVGLLLLKLAGALVIGLVTTVATIAIAAVVIFGLIWAFRHL